MELKRTLLTIFFIVTALLCGARTDEKRLQIVVYNLDAQGIGGSISDILTSSIVSELSLSEKLFVRDEKTTIAVLKEKGIAQTDYCNAEVCRIDNAKLIKADRIVLGSVGKLEEKLYVVNIRVADVDGTTLYPQKQLCEECSTKQLLSVVEGMAKNVKTFLETGKKPEPAPTPGPTSSAPSPAVLHKSIDTLKIANSGLFQSFQPGKAMVIFYRPKTAGQNGGWVSQNVYEGATVIGNLSSGTYFYYEPEPGVRAFKIRHSSIKFGTGDLLLNAGQTIFIESGFDKEGKGVMEASLVAPNIGLAEAKQCRYKAPKQVGGQGRF